MAGEQRSDFRLENRTLYCIFAGRLGTNECPPIEEELEQRLADRPDAVVFDLGNVEFVASAFLRTCIRTAKRLAGGGLSIINASPLIQDVLKTAGFDRLRGIDVH